MFLVIAASIVIAPSLLANLYDPTNVINQSKAIGSLLPDGARAKTRGRLTRAAAHIGCDVRGSLHRFGEFDRPCCRTWAAHVAGCALLFDRPAGVEEIESGLAIAITESPV